MYQYLGDRIFEYKDKVELRWTGNCVTFSKNKTEEYKYKFTFPRQTFEVMCLYYKEKKDLKLLKDINKIINVIN